jgi:general nucleoside transport system permease protein
MPGLDVHWGLVVGIVACVPGLGADRKTTWGFAARIAGGNVRAAQIQGLPVGRLIIGFTALGGAFAGLAGAFEVAAVQGSANGSLAAGYGYTGILVAFLARHNPLAIIPVAMLLAGFEASSGWCSGGWTCPMPRCWCCRASSSSRSCQRDLLRPSQGLCARTLERPHER